MILRHSMELLEQLTELETRLREWEEFMARHGLQVDENVLRAVYNRHVALHPVCPLTEKKKVS